MYPQTSRTRRRCASNCPASHQRPFNWTESQNLRRGLAEQELPTSWACPQQGNREGTTATWSRGSKYG